MKSICLLMILVSLLSLAYCDDTRTVAANQQSSTMNFFTLFYVQNQFFWCLMATFTALFWGDGGYYFRHCFNTFVAKPVFY